MFPQNFNSLSSAAGLCFGGQYLMPPELGESFSQILDQIEELGVDEFPPEVGFLNILRLFHTMFQPNEGIM